MSYVNCALKIKQLFGSWCISHFGPFLPSFLPAIWDDRICSFVLSGKADSIHVQESMWTLPFCVVTSQCDSPLDQPSSLQKYSVISSWFVSLLRSQAVTALNGKTVNGPKFPLMLLYFMPYNGRGYPRLAFTSLWQSTECLQAGTSIPGGEEVPWLWGVEKRLREWNSS